MKIVIRKAKIVDIQSSYHQQTVDILVDNGVIDQIGTDLSITNFDHEILLENLHLSQGWFDLRGRISEPGHEHKEDLETGIAAAIKGGYTDIAILPSTAPVIQTKSDVTFLKNRMYTSKVNIHPIGAISKNLEGKEITEMYDMDQHGAIAFSDDQNYIENPNLMKIALLYSKNFSGTLMSFPHQHMLNKGGQINEGVISTRMGLKGIPSLSEEIAIDRDIALANYCESPIHFSCISSANSVDKIKEAKASGQKITSSVPAHNLFFLDKDVEGFDTNLKVMPPLRTSHDRDGLIQGIKDGHIQAIVSDHQPQEIELKKCEFDNAEFGMIGYQTSFAAAYTGLISSIDLDKIVHLFTDGPRNIVGLPLNTIEKGAQAIFTLFNPMEEFILDEKSIASKSKNSPFIGKSLKAKVYGIVNKGQYELV